MFYQTASLQEQGIHQSPTGDPLHNHRHASDFQLLTSWASPEQEAQPCHVCSRPVGLVTGRPVPRAIRDWVVVHRRPGYKIISIYKPPPSCTVLQCSYLPHWPCRQWHLVNCDWMPVSYTGGQSPYSHRHRNSWASSQRSCTFSSMPCHGAWAPPLSAHLSTECECTVSQIKTPVCAHRTTTYQFIWQQQHTCGALGDHR